MRYFFTAEMTTDVGLDEFRILIDFETALNRVAADLTIEGIDFIGVVVMIMNPEFGEPWPPGMIIRRKRREWDIKPTIAFNDWTVADPMGRVDLFVRATLGQLTAQSRTRVPEKTIRDLEAALHRGRRELLN